ncbi:MAG TPA: hypothetical protein VMS30_09430 [Phycisphaerales bacterium]|nr:hypothetical protein [Phycisphaerales bacterium]
MLRLPVSKIYRAFPELDRFSDEQCERYVAFAKGDIGCLFFIIPPLATVALFVMCVFVFINAAAWANFRIHGTMSVVTGIVYAVGVISFLFGLPLAGGFLARDLVLHRLLRRHVRSRVERTRCPACRYSLLGQRVVAGVIGCPECGGTTTLAALGLLSEDELIPNEADV